MPSDDSPAVVGEPLWELEAVAPSNQAFSAYQTRWVYHPFSNDESAAQHRQVAEMMQAPELSDVDNDVAIIVGEGSLVAALAFLRQPTIIMPDYSMKKVAYMKAYIDWLRTCDSPKEWRLRLEREAESLQLNPPTALVSLDANVRHWKDKGLVHPLAVGGRKEQDKEVEDFRQASGLACSKAIIPWCVDVNDPDGMAGLAGELIGRNATVTFMNLTNVIEANNASKADVFDNFAKLPLANAAPILATQYVGDSAERARRNLPNNVLCVATGPHVGLRGLRSFSE